MRDMRIDRTILSASAARTFAWIGLLLWAAFAILPMLWLVLAATKSGAALATEHPFAFGSFARVGESWEHLAEFNDGVLYRWLGNTVILTGAQMVLTLVATVPAGYALGACTFRMRKPILMATLGLILLPGGALVLPQFLEMVALGLVGTRWAVILPGAVFPLGLYLTFIYFSSTIGRDVYDAARIDGCSEWKVFLKVAMPLAAPIAALVTFFSFTRNWGEFLLPYIMLSSDDFPLPVGLALLASVAPELNPNSIVQSDIGIPEVVLATLLTMLPVLLVLIFAQRIVLRGATIMGGALKG
ncbi:carbohydrate ABC transporter permease [Ruania alkalisoli]|uniref:Carbohydrate ABC transporter permease n=1 Tax=Ruania alkalisoli TaxID=2779775 RepID=A0A7M1SSE7_9MICO|nr:MULTISPECIES: carbohydrate ABC transporter permease [Ruania]QOR70480.1 carbohydrate ABC transporter permease [Ruania alkalisoli]